MKQEMNKEYYDNILGKAPQYSLSVNADHSWHSDLYAFVITLFAKEDKILELGCGTGQFAEKIISNGFHYVAGIDFSTEGIKLCEQRCPDTMFLCENLYDFNFNHIPYNTILSLETMEHLTGDLEILNKIRKGTKVILSIPSFDDPAHVRFFKTENDVSGRYAAKFQSCKIHKTGRYFIIEAIK